MILFLAQAEDCSNYCEIKSCARRVGSNRLLVQLFTHRSSGAAAAAAASPSTAVCQPGKSEASHALPARTYNWGKQRGIKGGVRLTVAAPPWRRKLSKVVCVMSSISTPSLLEMMLSLSGYVFLRASIIFFRSSGYWSNCSLRLSHKYASKFVATLSTLLEHSRSSHVAEKPSGSRPRRRRSSIMALT
jgi:hypothetical protein